MAKAIFDSFFTRGMTEFIPLLKEGKKRNLSQHNQKMWFHSIVIEVT
jgi:hypothetical protein